MDPITAFSLASSIATFVGFGLKLVSHTSELYTSAAGARAEAVEIENATTHLLDALGLLRAQAALATSRGVDTSTLR